MRVCGLGEAPGRVMKGREEIVGARRRRRGMVSGRRGGAARRRSRGGIWDGWFEGSVEGAAVRLGG